MGRCTCTCRLVHLACASLVASAVKDIAPAPAVSYVAPAPADEYIASAPPWDAASAPVRLVHLACASLVASAVKDIAPSSRSVLLWRLRHWMSILRLRPSWDAASALVVGYILPAPAGYAAPVPVVDYIAAAGDAAPAPVVCAQLGTQHQHLPWRTSLQLPQSLALLLRQWMSTWRLRQRCTQHQHQL